MVSFENKPTTAHAQGAQARQTWHLACCTRQATLPAGLPREHSSQKPYMTEPESGGVNPFPARPCFHECQSHLYGGVTQQPILRSRTRTRDANIMLARCKYARYSAPALKPLAGLRSGQNICQQPYQPPGIFRARLWRQ